MEQEELHELISLLREDIVAGRLKVNSTVDLDSLSRVRLAPNGLVDPATVDSAVRALARVAAMGRARRKLRTTSLRDVQSRYFDILEKFFGEPYAEMRRHKLDPHRLSKALAADHEILSAFRADAEEFAGAMREFWAEFGPVVEVHLQDLRSLKSVFGGDIFPSYTSNIACSVGLYMDSIIVPDPLLKLADFVGRMDPQDLLYFTTKHALNALGYRELALAEVDPPIVVIAPDMSYTDETYRMALSIAGQADLIKHAARIFGRPFSTAKDVGDFLGGFSDPQDLASNLADSSRLLFDVEWREPLAEQLRRNQTEINQGTYPSQPGTVGEAAFRSLLGRMAQANEVLFKTVRFGGTPLIDAPTSWQYLQWKYEYDGTADVETSDLRDTLISKAVEAEGSKEFGLLSGMPAQALIELRRNGALSEVREVLRNGIGEMDLASATALTDVSDRVIANVDRAFEKHASDLHKFSSSRRRFFGLDVGAWIVTSGVSLAAAKTGSAGLAMLAAATVGLVGPPSVRELWKRYGELSSNRLALRRSPTGILFHHLGGKFGLRAGENRVA